MKKLVILFIIAAIFLTGCGWFTEMGRNNPLDPDSAWIDSHTPAAGATSVALNAAVTVTFLRDLDAATVTADTFTLTAGGEAVEGTPAYSDADRILTFTPSSSFSYATTYTATLPAAGIADLEGTSLLTAYTWSFTTVGAPAPSGSLDTTFGGSGYVSEDKYSGNNEYGLALTLDDGDGVLIAGYEDAHSSNTVIRYTSDGVLDESFTGGFSIYSTDGYVEFGGFGDYSFVKAIALQSDGKVIVAGSDGSYFRMTCLTSSGAVDASFDGDETMTYYPYNGEVYFYPEDLGVELNSSTLSLEKALSLSGGKVLLAGSAYTNFESNGHSGSYYADVVILKIEADGSLDTDFGGGDGCVTFNYTSLGINVTSAALDDEGRIVVCGYDDSYNGIIARFTSSGVIDASFNSGGYVVDDRAYDIYYSDVEVASDGSIVVMGVNSTGSSNPIVLARYSETGTPDAAFDGDSGGNGFIEIDPDPVPGYSYKVFDMVLDDEGRIIICGSVEGDEAAFLLRLTTTGIPDASFDGEESMESYPGNGYLRIDVGASPDHFTALAVDSEGRIVVSGYYTDTGGFANPLVFRFWP